MQTEKKNIEEIIVSFLNHKATEDELTELDAWLDESETNREYLATCQKIWLSEKQQYKSFDEKRAFKLFLKRIGRVEEYKSRYFRKSPVSYLRIGSYASMIIVCLALGILLQYLWSERNREITHYVVDVPFGSKTKLTMPDSTEVWLNAGSKFKYSSDFGKSNRNVQLLGEAYFNVTRNEKIPFVVKTSSINIQVLGTSFCVNNFEDTENVKIILERGNIALKNEFSNNTIYLKPNQEAVYSKKNNKISISESNTKDLAGWREGRISFEVVELEEIARQLQRQFNVEIVIANDQIRKKSYYGSFTLDQNIKDIIDIICESSKLKYTQKGQKIIIY